MTNSIDKRARERRDALRVAGLRPVQLWLPDTRAPGFAEECRRQALLVAEAETRNGDLAGFLDAVLVDLNGSGA